MWLQLEEKRIPYTIEKINMRCYGDKPASFMAKVPRGLLPVIGARARCARVRVCWGAGRGRPAAKA